jgi:hypothetical protein
MATGKCLECGKDISSSINICPSCEKKFKATDIKWKVTLIFFAVISVWWVSNRFFFEDKKRNMSVSSPSATTAPIIKKTPEASNTREVIQNISKKDGSFDARPNDLEELCRDYVFYRRRILQYSKEGKTTDANEARTDFRKVNAYLDAYNDKDISAMFTKIGETK